METPGTSRPLAAEAEVELSNYRMIDVGDKAVTHRRAVATGRLYADQATLRRIAAGDLPKGDVLRMAEVAGIQAAKKTAEILPLCHPIALDSVRVRCLVDEASVSVTCEAVARAKTGVEMEALNGTMAALLCIYDLVKGIDPVLSIGRIYLQSKTGGKSGEWTHPVLGGVPTHAHEQHEQKPALSHVKSATVVVSDRCSAGKARDVSGKLIQDWLLAEGAQVAESALIPDDKTAIQRMIHQLATEAGAELIIASGGTGLGPRDVTPDALREMGAKDVPGIGERLRSSGARHTSMSWLSRGGAMTYKGALILMLPGSPDAVRQGLETVRDLLGHAVHILHGGNHT